MSSEEYLHAMAQFWPAGSLAGRRGNLTVSCASPSSATDWCWSPGSAAVQLPRPRPRRGHLPVPGSH
eukprot:1674159-Pyramimonas_sp.AAC.1